MPVDQLDDVETLVATGNNWQIWKCLKWIPAQNRCNTPLDEEHTSGCMTKHGYTRGMKFDRVESGAGKYPRDEAIQLLGELPQALGGRQRSAGWHTTQ